MLVKKNPINYWAWCLDTAAFPPLTTAQVLALYRAAHPTQGVPA